MFAAFELAPGCLEFLEWTITQFRCRWLSTRCRHRWPDGSRRAFRLVGARLINPRWAVLDQVEPAGWTTSKTEAMDPTSGFWWVDDAVSREAGFKFLLIDLVDAENGWGRLPTPQRVPRNQTQVDVICRLPLYRCMSPPTGSIVAPYSRNTRPYEDRASLQRQRNANDGCSLPVAKFLLVRPRVM
jgi:hypothetical protein